MVLLASNVAEASLLALLVVRRSTNRLLELDSFCARRSHLFYTIRVTCELIFTFGGQNSGRFKVLIQDLVKIRSSELTWMLCWLSTLFST